MEYHGINYVNMMEYHEIHDGIPTNSNIIYIYIIYIHVHIRRLQYGQLWSTSVNINYV